MEGSAIRINLVKLTRSINAVKAWASNGPCGALKIVAFPSNGKADGGKLAENSNFTPYPGVNV